MQEGKKRNKLEKKITGKQGVKFYEQAIVRERPRDKGALKVVCRARVCDREIRKVQLTAVYRLVAATKLAGDQRF